MKHNNDAVDKTFEREISAKVLQKTDWSYIFLNAQSNITMHFFVKGYILLSSTEFTSYNLSCKLFQNGIVPMQDSSHEPKALWKWLVRTKLLQKVDWSSIFRNAPSNIARNLRKIDWSNACPVKFNSFKFNFHGSCSGMSLSQCNTICVNRNIVRKATEKNQVVLEETFPSTLQLRFSKLYKISSRNISPPPGVRWHDCLDNTQGASQVILTHWKTLRATQSANLNLGMTQILYQVEEIDLFGISGLQLKYP